MSLDTPFLRMVAIALLVGFVAGGCVWYAWAAVGGLRRAAAAFQEKRKRAAEAKAKEQPAPEKETAKPAR